MKKSPFFPLLIPSELWDVPPLPWRARVYTTNLLQAFSSLFFGIYAAMSSHLTARVLQMWEAAIPLPLLVCCFIQRAFLHPAQVLFPLFPAPMHWLQAQSQMKSPEKWVYELTSSLRKVSLLLYFITAARENCAFCSTTPSAMIPWGILLIIFQSDSQLTISFQNHNLSRRRKIVTCPLFSGNEKGILEDFYNSIKLTRILRTDWQKWQPKKDWNVQCLFSWHNPS